MRWMRHPQVPWVEVAATGSAWLVRNGRTGEVVAVESDLRAHQVAAQWASTPGRYGLGDVVHRVTDALGIEQCSPCAQRQAALNRLVPSLWRR